MSLVRKVDVIDLNIDEPLVGTESFDFLSSDINKVMYLLRKTNIRKNCVITYSGSRDANDPNTLVLHFEWV